MTGQGVIIKSTDRTLNGCCINVLLSGQTVFQSLAFSSSGFSVWFSLTDYNIHLPSVTDGQMPFWHVCFFVYLSININYPLFHQSLLLSSISFLTLRPFCTLRSPNPPSSASVSLPPLIRCERWRDGAQRKQSAHCEQKQGAEHGIHNSSILTNPYTHSYTCPHIW